MPTCFPPSEPVPRWPPARWSLRMAPGGRSGIPEVEDREGYGQAGHGHGQAGHGGRQHRLLAAASSVLARISLARHDAALPPSVLNEPDRVHTATPVLRGQGDEQLNNRFSKGDEQMARRETQPESTPTADGLSSGS